MSNEVKNEVKIGNKLRLCRESMNPKKTQQEIADALGIQRTYLSALERDEGLPSYDLLAKIVEFYNTSFDFIFGHQQYDKRQYMFRPELSVSEERTLYQPDTIQQVIWLMRDLPEEKQQAILKIAQVVKDLN